MCKRLPKSVAGTQQYLFIPLFKEQNSNLSDFIDWSIWESRALIVCSWWPYPAAYKITSYQTIVWRQRAVQWPNALKMGSSSTHWQKAGHFVRSHRLQRQMTATETSICFYYMFEYFQVIFVSLWVLPKLAPPSFPNKHWSMDYSIHDPVSKRRHYWWWRNG